MEQSKVNYQGINNRNDEYLSADGELSAAINLINDTGAYRAIKTPDKLLTLNEGERVIYIHKNLDYEHYIIVSETGLYYINTTDSSDTPRNLIQEKSYSLETPPKISSIGNTLIILDTDALEYALFRTDCYLPLGNKPPVADISFGLSGEFTISDKFNVVDENIYSEIFQFSDRNSDFSLEDVTYEDDDDHVDEFITSFTENTLSEVNKFINEKVTEENKFIYPFFIRYAYRMYDGTYYMHSHPILMVPSTDINPIVFIQNFECYSNGTTSDDVERTKLLIDAHVSALICEIKYKLNRYYDELTDTTTDGISNWSELITSLDIFITTPSYSYDQNGKVYGWKYITEDDTLDTYSLAHIANSNFSNTDEYKKYEYPEQFILTQENFEFNREIDCITTTYNSTTVKYPCYYMELPRITYDTRYSNLCTDSIFYRIASLSLDELSEELTPLEITDGVITNLQQQTQLTDDYKSHTQITATATYTYNSRLNLGNITEYIYNGMPLSAQFPLNLNTETIDNTIIYTYLNKDGAEYIVSSPSNSDNIAINPYYFFPDTDAYKQIIIQYSGNKIITQKEIILTSHTLLNGAYHFEGFYNELSDTDETPIPTTNNTTCYQSTIYTSYIMNPFLFPAELINSVGTGSIVALSSATKAISEGQFGQFPLHAFTTEGIWALELSDTGGYSSCQPITRDVIKGEEVLQLEQSLVYPTEKGIMILSGGESKCITTSLDGKFDPTRLSKLTELLTITNHSNLTLPDIEFSEFIDDCILTYDHINSRIYISNDKYNYSYIFSEISQVWSCVSYAFSNSLSNYSNALVTMIDSQEIESIYQLNGTEVAEKSLIITRPIKLGVLNQYKSISTIITQGILESESQRVPIALYASIDSIKYIPIATSATEKIIGIQGSPYKYFIIVQPLNLTDSESIFGVEIAFEPRKTDKLR